MKKIERMKLGELKMNPSNPRTISEGQLKKLIVSLLVFPKMLEIRPIVVDSECQVLGGNQRLKALEEIAEASDEELDKWLQESSEYKAKSAEEQVAIFNHWQEWREEPRAYVIKASDLSEEEVQAFIIKDNVPFGEWDWELLEADWDLPMLEEWGLDFPDFDNNGSELFGDYDDGLELKEEGDTLSNTEALNRIKVGTNTIRFTDEEKERFVASIERYADTYGMLTGYISHLLDCEDKSDGRD